MLVALAKEVMKMCDNCPHCAVIGGPCRIPGCHDVAGHPGPCPSVYIFDFNDPALKGLEKKLKAKRRAPKLKRP